MKIVSLALMQAALLSSLADAANMLDNPGFEGNFNGSGALLELDGRGTRRTEGREAHRY